MDDSSAARRREEKSKRRKRVTFTSSTSLEPSITIHSYPSAVASYCSSSSDDKDDKRGDEDDNSNCEAATTSEEAKGELWYNANEFRTSLHKTLQQIMVANQMNITLDEGTTTRGLEGYTAYGREQKEKAIEEYRQMIVEKSSSSSSSSKSNKSRNSHHHKTTRKRHSHNKKHHHHHHPFNPPKLPPQLQQLLPINKHHFNNAQEEEEEEETAEILVEYSLGATQCFKDMANMMGYQDECEARRIYEQDGIEGMLTKQQGFVDTTVKIRLTSRLWVE